MEAFKVIWGILLFSMVNLGIGYALAVTIGQPVLAEAAAGDPVLPDGDELAPDTHHDSPALTAATSAPNLFPQQESQEKPESPARQLIEEIPEQWHQLLEQEHIFAGSFVEASVQVLRLEISKYRAQLIQIDDQVRLCAENPDTELLQKILEELKTVNTSWLTQQTEAAGHLSSHSEGLDGFQEMGSDLEGVLMEQAAQIETTCNNVDHLDFKTDIPDGCRRLIVEIRKLIDLAHALRDRMHDSLLTIVKAENRLADLDQKLQHDSLTGIFNRSGLERIFHNLWAEKSNKVRQHSCAMVDLDQFSRLLEQYGAVACDQILSSFTTLMTDLIRKDRGFDVISRFDGQRFIIFYGDTGPRNATSGIERVRQTLEQSAFVWHGTEIELTASCGVVEVQTDDTTNTIFKRLAQAVRVAKKNGRNRTCLDEGNGPVTVDPPKFKVKSHLLPIG
jgi:diguanylate cyclase